MSLVRTRELGLADAGGAEEQEQCRSADRGPVAPRERRRALAMASIASSWPITRSCKFGDVSYFWGRLRLLRHLGYTDLFGLLAGVPHCLG